VKSEKSNQKREYLVKNVWLVFSLIFLIGPLVFLILKSIAFSWSWPELIPTSYSLRGWNVLVQEPRIWYAIGMTLMIGGVVVLLNLLFALPAGKALAHYSFQGKSFVEAILFMPILIPTLAVAMGIHLTMIKIGLADRWWGVVLVHLIPTLPYSIRILRSGYERLGTRMGDQARSLGVSPWMVFRTISLPLLLPSIRSAILLVFVISLSQYMLTALIGGGNVLTLAMIYYPFLSSVDEAAIASFSILFAILPILFLLVGEGCIRLFIPRKLRTIKEN
jgi:putative spermidine/putrescine transport system permease protein